MRWTDYASTHVERWLAVIGGFLILAVPASCFPRRPLPYRSSVVGFLAFGRPCFWNVSYAFPVDVVMVKS